MGACRQPSGVFRLLATVLLLVLSSSQTSATQLSNDDISESEELFVRRIVPIMQQKCLGCHGLQQGLSAGGLDLRNPRALEGGDSGQPLLVPGNAETSALFLAVQRNSDVWSAMPPKDAERLTAEQITWIAEWINAGAPWPDADRIAVIRQSKEAAWSLEDGIVVRTSGGLSEEWNQRRYQTEALWAFQPVNPRGLPTSRTQTIDELVDRQIPKGLEPAGSADATVFIRRASFDLLGLPPSMDEIQAFQMAYAADQNNAVADLIDRLLTSPHYGERMAQHWLDVVRYADSAGFANDYERGSAWRYRDYVVRSFNADKPFDQFVIEQIAGDEFQPNDPESLIATGFLRMGPWELTGMEVARVARQRFLDDVTNSVGETFLAQPLQCARCHDHKFDPIPTRDYYSIQAAFATTQLAEREVPFLPDENQSGFKERVYLERRQRDYISALESLDSILLANAEAWFQQNGRNIRQWNEALDSVRQRRSSTKSRSDLFNQTRQVLLKARASEDSFPPKLTGLTPEQLGLERVARKGLERLEWELDRYKPRAHAVYSGHTPDLRSVTMPLRMPENLLDGELEQTSILSGGDPFSPGTSVSPGVLSVIAMLPAKVPDSLSQRRLELARWIADQRNPLTARVIANRIWMWHFGIPLAGNPNNFGTTGRRPTHPELLDVLAASLIQNRWSIKSLHRMIMQSQAYRRSGQHADVRLLREVDPNLSSYAVFRSRRLTAEELRDSMLTASGELNPAIGGIPNRPEINIEVALQPRQVMGTFASAWVPNPLPSQRHRRSLYSLRLRGLADPSMEVFNQPSPDFSCERRDVSLVTPQVLTLMNSQSSYARALAMADRVLKIAVNDNGRAIDLCFQVALGRAPESEEKHACLEHWRTSLEETDAHLSIPFRRLPSSIVREAVEENTGEHFSFEERLYAIDDFVPDLQPADCDSRVRTLADVCLVLLNSSEFSYVE